MPDDSVRHSPLLRNSGSSLNRLLFFVARFCYTFSKVYSKVYIQKYIQKYIRKSATTIIIIMDLNTIRDTIEVMTKFNQVEILRILSKHSEVTLNENKYGVHINLTDLDESIINKLVVYINYVNTQELALKQDEKQKEDFKNIYFSQKA